MFWAWNSALSQAARGDGEWIGWETARDRRAKQRARRNEGSIWYRRIATGIITLCCFLLATRVHAKCKSITWKSSRLWQLFRMQSVCAIELHVISFNHIPYVLFLWRAFALSVLFLCILCLKSSLLHSDFLQIRNRKTIYFKKSPNSSLVVQTAFFDTFLFLQDQKTCRFYFLRNNSVDPWLHSLKYMATVAECFSRHLITWDYREVFLTSEIPLELKVRFWSKEY